MKIILLSSYVKGPVRPRDGSNRLNCSLWECLHGATKTMTCGLHKYQLRAFNSFVM